MLVVAFIGKKGSGKEVAGNILMHLAETQGFTVERHRFSNILNETLMRFALPQTTENLQKLPVTMEQAFGKGVLSNAVGRRIRRSRADLVVADGVRWNSDAKMIISLPRSLICYIDAPRELRFEWRKRRNRAGESELTFNKFLEQDSAPTEIEIAGLKTYADVILTNNDDDSSNPLLPKSLKTQIDKMYFEKIRPILKNINPEA